MARVSIKIRSINFSNAPRQTHTTAATPRFYEPLSDRLRIRTYGPLRFGRLKLMERLLLASYLCYKVPE